MQRKIVVTNVPCQRHVKVITLVAVLVAAVQVGQVVSEPLDQSGLQWAPFLEWSLPNPTFMGNPYDLIATATFVHQASGETHTTGMFYAGGTTWEFRFTGTRPGTWTFTTASSDTDLAGHSGTVAIAANPEVPGFVTHDGSTWTHMGTKQAFAPQFVMYGGPHRYHKNPGKIDADIVTFLKQHGFTGFHVPVFCRWFDINQERCDAINVPNPDPRTFDALELLVTKVHAAGGTVHFWVWGDSSRWQNPQQRWGLNSLEDRRLQRYIAARLGPLPGWTMGYGFDLWEWASERDLQAWHAYMHQHLGWSHLLGGRASKNQLNQLYEGFDYSGYEQHKPDYDTYVETIAARPHKPSFSEDRFRLRNEGRSKDYTMEETRRALWHAAMAGGVANIWGNLVDGTADANEGLRASAPYPKPEWIKTNTVFFAERFAADLERCNTLTDGVCLRRPDKMHYLLYKENTASIQMNLAGMVGPQRAVAVDTRKAYAEIDLGLWNAAQHTWTAPYISDWAIAVGPMETTEPDTVPPLPPTILETR